MRPSTRLTIAAGCAAALASAPIGALFESISWLFPAVAGIAMVTCCHVLARTLRLPAVLVPVVGAAGLLLFLCFAYAHDGNALGLIPTGRSLELLRDGLSGGLDDIRTYAAPAPNTQGLLLVVTLTAGLTTVVVDTLAVTARRPAVAGLIMLALYAVPTAISAAAVPWLYFVASACGYLVLLLAEERERLLRWGRPVSATDPSWHGDPAPIRFSGRRAGIAALVVAVLLPLFVPGISASGLANLGNDGGGGPGNGTRIDPFATLKGYLNRGGNPVEMLQLSATDDRLHYVRTQVLDKYSDGGWSQTTPSPSGPADGSLATETFGNTQTYRATIKISEYNDKYLPIPTGTNEISGLQPGENWQYDDQRSMVFSSIGQSPGKNYELGVAEPVPTVTTLQLSQPVPRESAIMRDFGDVPRNFPVAVSRKVQELTAGARGPYDRARAIRQYFSIENGFSYSVSTLAGDTGSDLADFVLEKKQGYCQQYAAAMAIMLREAGIPARVVLGFTRHGPAKDGHWSILNTDAHAWVESYFTGLGWIPWDPTPPDASTPGRITGFAPWDVRQSAQTSAPSTSGPAESSDVPSGGAAGEKETDATQDPLAAQQGGPLITPTQILVLSVALVVLLLLLTPALVRLRQRRRRLALAGEDDAGAAARAAWDELMATATDLDVPLRSDETPRAVARRVASELALDGPPSAGLRLLALAEERARYAAAADVDGDLPTAVRAVRTGLLESRRRRRRVRAAMLPPSVLRAARTSLLRRNDRFTSQLDRMNSDVRRLVRRRTRPRG
jgi:transglutaminase-like putative cysteine protease